MTDDPNAPPPVQHHELRSTISRRDDKRRRQKREESDLPYKEMLEALMRGTTAWNDWQKKTKDKNPSIDFYDFKDLDFSRKINLEGIIFNKPVSFRRTTFKGVNFKKVKFEKKVSFSHATFNGEVNFEEAEFGIRVTAPAQAFFLNTTFAGTANFKKAEFNKEAYFKKAIFAKKANFERVVFYEDGNFMAATFTEEANFEHVIFDYNSNGNFALAIFNKEADFASVKFFKKADFWQTTFANQAYFSGADFAKRADFARATFQSSVFFTGALFVGDQINFSEMTLSADSNLLFEGTSFDNAVPDFRYLNRNPDIRFHNFSVPSPDELIKRNKWSKYDDNEDCYRKLKELAIGNDNHEYELKFYGYEMDSKLKKFKEAKEERIFNKRWWMDILPTRFYKCFSNYGQSIWRPLICLAVLAVIFYNPYLDWNAISKTILSWLPFINNIDWVMICKTILPLPLFTFVNDVDVSGNSSIRLISDGAFAIKTIASFFWFLFFLAMRNKFKIK